MKVTFVHGRYFNSWEALGIGYLASYLKSQMNDVETSFFQGYFDDDETILSGSHDSDIVAFSCTSPTFPFSLDISRRLKEQNPKIVTVVGGYHPSAIGDACLVEGIDHVVVGEGETAIVDIARGSRERIVHGRPLDFAELPWPDRGLIRSERNIQVAYNDNKKRVTSFQSHRGCPFHCKYCADGYIKVLYPGHKKSPVRFRPVADLLDEMQEVTRAYRLDLMKFTDPTWNTSLDWVNEFCREKIRRGFATPFYPNIHAGVCTEEMFNLMAEAGCYEIGIGVESGSPRILKQIGKGTNIEMIKRSIGWAKKAGILVRGYFILGMPDEAEADIRKTEALAEQLDLDEYGFSILCPYPGTQMYTTGEFNDIDWTHADEYSNDFWRTKHLTNRELKDWQSYLKEKFRPKLTWHNKVV